MMSEEDKLISELECINREYVELVGDLVNEINSELNKEVTIADLRYYCQRRWPDYFGKEVDQ